MLTNYQTATATMIKNNLGDYLQEAMTKEPVVIERHGKAVAVLVGFEDWQKLQGRKVPKRQAWFEACEALVQEMQRRNPKKVTSAVQLIRELREEAS